MQTSLSGHADRKTMSGGIVRVCGMIVVWLSKKQACVSHSTMVAEIVAALQVTADLLNVVEVLSEFGVRVLTPCGPWDK